VNQSKARGVHRTVLACMTATALGGGAIVAQPALAGSLCVGSGSGCYPTIQAAASVEAVAYFIVSEALTNVVKHAQATQAEVTVTRHGDVLRIAVTDDGSGGAVPPEGDGAGAGTGLRGLAQRAAAVDGTLTIDSPPGGPTVITAELPCES
jgi:signal transduction histidine kinase